MGHRSKSQSDSPLLPRWAWWLALSYMVLLLLNYAVIFPLRYQEIQARGLPEFLVIFQIGSDYFLIGLLGLLGFFLMFRMPYDRHISLIAITLLSGYPGISGLIILSRDVSPLL